MPKKKEAFANSKETLAKKEQTLAKTAETRVKTEETKLVPSLQMVRDKQNSRLQKP